MRFGKRIVHLGSLNPFDSLRFGTYIYLLDSHIGEELVGDFLVSLNSHIGEELLCVCCFAVECSTPTLGRSRLWNCWSQGEESIRRLGGSICREVSMCSDDAQTLLLRHTACFFMIIGCFLVYNMLKAPAYLGENVWAWRDLAARGAAIRWSTPLKSMSTAVLGFLIIYCPISH